MVAFIVSYYFFEMRYVKLFFDFTPFVCVCFFLQVMVFCLIESLSCFSYDKR